jgi:hypothetical protein
MRVYLAVPVRGEPMPEGSVAGLRDAVEGSGHALVNEPGVAPPSALVAQADSRYFIQEVDRMLEADLLVAEVSSPSHDVGWTVAWFLAKGRLAILCCRREARERLSPLLGGNPSPWQKIVVYESPEDLASKFGALVKR